MSRLAAALVRSFRLSRAYCSPVHVGLSAICFLRTAAREPGLERPAGTGRWQPGRGGGLVPQNGLALGHAVVLGLHPELG